MVDAFVSPSAAERRRAARFFIDGVPVATELLIVGASREAADDLARRVDGRARRDLPRQAEGPGKAGRATRALRE